MILFVFGLLHMHRRMTRVLQFASNLFSCRFIWNNKWEHSIFYLTEGLRFPMSLERVQLSSSIDEWLAFNRDHLFTKH